MGGSDKDRNSSMSIHMETTIPNSLGRDKGYVSPRVKQSNEPASPILDLSLEIEHRTGI
jgi:hypothetical protein